MAFDFNFIKNKLTQKQQDPVFIWSWRISFVCLGLAFLLFLIVWGKLPPVLPFYYSLPWGDEQLASPVVLPVFLGIVLLFYCILSIGALLLRMVSDLYARILIVGITLLTLMSVYTVIRIILLVI